MTFRPSTPKPRTSDGGHESAGDSTTETTATYLRVLERISSAEGFASLLHPNVTLDARGTGHLWHCTTKKDVVDMARRAYHAGVRTEIFHSNLVGDRMMIFSRLRVPESVSEIVADGPVDGQRMYRVFTLRNGLIAHIRDCADDKEALFTLLRS